MIIILSYYKVWQCNFAGFFDIFRITKCDKVILLKSVTNCYYKVRQVLPGVTDCHYKVRQVLQSVTAFITKCVRYYKVWPLLKSEMQHWNNSRWELLTFFPIWVFFSHDIHNSQDSRGKGRPFPVPLLHFQPFDEHLDLGFINTYTPLIGVSYYVILLLRISLHKKWSFPLRISAVNVTRFEVFCGFGHIYWKILNGKPHFFCSVWL